MRAGPRLRLGAWQPNEVAALLDETPDLAISLSALRALPAGSRVVVNRRLLDRACHGDAAALETLKRNIRRGLARDPALFRYALANLPEVAEAMAAEPTLTIEAASEYARIAHAHARTGVGEGAERLRAALAVARRIGAGRGGVAKALRHVPDRDPIKTAMAKESRLAHEATRVPYCARRASEQLSLLSQEPALPPNELAEEAARSIRAARQRAAEPQIALTDAIAEGSPIPNVSRALEALTSAGDYGAALLLRSFLDQRRIPLVERFAAVWPARPLDAYRLACQATTITADDVRRILSLVIETTFNPRPENSEHALAATELVSMLKARGVNVTEIARATKLGGKSRLWIAEYCGEKSDVVAPPAIGDLTLEQAWRLYGTGGEALPSQPVSGIRYPDPRSPRFTRAIEAPPEKGGLGQMRIPNL